MMGDTATTWPERYRPDVLDGMALDPGVRKRLEQYLEGHGLPHLILHGPPRCI